MSGMGIALGREKEHEPGVKYLNVADLDARYTVYAYYKKNNCAGNVKGFLTFLKSERT